MKCTNNAIVLFLISCQIIGTLSTKLTPKGTDLANHYGTEPVADQFGPKANVGVNLRREGVSAGVAITPILNYDKEINNSQVKSGDLDNTSFDASKIITPSLAKPKAEIKTTFTHEAVVKTPVHLGNQIEEKTITKMDRMTGQVDTQIVQTEKPILGLLNTVREVQTQQTTVVDLTTGKIDNAEPAKALHGSARKQ